MISLYQCTCKILQTISWLIFTISFRNTFSDGCGSAEGVPTGGPFDPQTTTMPKQTVTTRVKSTKLTDQHPWVEILFRSLAKSLGHQDNFLGKKQHPQLVGCLRRLLDMIWSFSNWVQSILGLDSWGFLLLDVLRNHSDPAETGIFRIPTTLCKDCDAFRIIFVDAMKTG